MHRRWRGPAGLLVTVLAAASVLAGPGAGLAAGRPGLPRVPMPGTASQLQAVSCTSASSCWAVGTYAVNGAGLNQVLRWNGSTWSLVAAPSPGGAASGATNELFGVGCASAADCWAVGDYVRNGAQLDEALHWNGTRWVLVATPDPGGTTSGGVNGLLDVWCTAADSCWAAGNDGAYSGPNETVFNQALHWDGTKWSAVPTPDPGGAGPNDFSALSALRCTSAASCWAVGDYGGPGASTSNEALHWNGTTWSLTTTPSPGGTAAGNFSTLSGLWCASATSCWAAGAYGSSGGTFTSLNQVLHWDGGHWSQVPTPDPDGTGSGASNLLTGVTCTSAGSCWAVGDYGSTGAGGTVLNEALRWNGTRWSLTATPDPAGTGAGASNRLNAVRCTSPGSCWAVGTQIPAQYDLDQALHWDGHAWTAQ